MADNRHIEEDIIDRARAVDIIGFLENNGIDVKRRGRSSLCSSPLSSDSDPSFVIYEEKNIFVDYSTGKKGDIIFLAQELLNITFPEAVRVLTGTDLPVWDKEEFKKKMSKRKPFNYDEHLTTDAIEVNAIKSYAESRKISHGYNHGFFYLRNKENNGFVKQLAMAFPHVDMNGEIIGVKFRNIDRSSLARYRAKGSLMYYYFNNWGKHPLFIVEGELNAASLRAYFELAGYQASIVSFGGVGDVPVYLPREYDDVYIVIDHDGNEKLYQERLKRYEHFNGTPIRLDLDIGEDINSLWVNNEFDYLYQLLK